MTTMAMMMAMMMSRKFTLWPDRINHVDFFLAFVQKSFHFLNKQTLFLIFSFVNEGGSKGGIKS